ncbi:glycosyltransferase [Bizionia paragorgiae]|uniref:Glycosyl transferases group 1 n=1 Tax=Bizionia paragorgiae TaxID=283786 RepID=A0A1H4BBR8_BIZPA|nr:glycosyltransferase [Bizionia paragorgiae]SEA45577.1 Glycosyl transferases group 1 [Bizionia paragorgiae]
MKNNNIDSICIVVPSLQKGGMERVVSLLGNNLLVYLKNVYIITLTSDKVEYEIDTRVNIIHLNRSLKNRVLLSYQLFKALRDIRPKVIVGFSEVFNPFTIVAGKLNGISVFVSDRSSPVIKYSFRDYILKKLTYPLSKGIIAQTDLAKRTLQIKKLNSNISILPNPVSAFNNTDFNFEIKRIISVGRLTKTKNQLELIKIFKEINNPEWELLIVGEGKNRVELERFISDNKLGYSVKMVGKKDNIEKQLSKASIFAFTSLSEGFPNVVLEAMAFPLATIAYDCPAGVSDLIENRVNGYLIPLNDFGLYKKELKFLMNNHEERLRIMKNAIKVREKYSQSIITKRFYDLITG